MAQGNLLQWSNSIRFNMVNDSGRELFQQQVQSQGFSFLDSYLENILSGTKQDPLIDLVKTPGRRKALAKKPKTASKLGNPIVFSLGPTSDETQPPANSTPAPAHLSLEAETKKPAHSPIDSKPVETRPVLEETQTITEPVPTHDDIEPESEMDDIASTADYLTAVPVDQANLSVIAEDDEPAERSRTSIMIPREPSPKPNSNKRSSPDTTSAQGEANSGPEPPAKVARMSSPKKEETHSGDTPAQYASRRSPSGASPSEYHSAQATPVSPVFSARKETKADVKELLEDPKLVKEHQQSKEAAFVSQAMGMDTDFTVMTKRLSHDTEDTMDMQVPIRDAESTSKMSIPSLPEPMPLRKSMRVPRDPSVGPVMMGAATPGNPAGKRTSWLIKAREVHARDKTAKKSTVGTSFPPPALPGSLGKGSKRKSGDMGAPSTKVDEQEHKSKVAKHLEGDNPSSKVAESSKKASPAPPVPPAQAEATPWEQTSPFGLFKNTVAGLFGKPAAKADGDVFSALAEAKAAAEARIAERNHQEDPQAVSTKAQDEQKEVAESNTSTGRRSPMAVTDLFPSEGRVKQKGKAPEKHFQFSPAPKKKKDEPSSNRDSTSTTPPHSPPAASPSFAPPVAKAVFNKPMPVFVPPTGFPAPRPLPSPPSIKEYTFQPPTSSIFSSALGINSSFSFTKPKLPLTAQSTLESVQSQSQQVFDDDEVPAWMPTTQDTEYTDGFETQTGQNMNVCDEDDSWPIDEKLAAGVQWTFGAGMNDSTTWSTLPTQSTRGDTGPHNREKTTSSLRQGEPTENLSRHSEQGRPIPGAFDFDMDHKRQGEDGEPVANEDKELEEAVLGGVRLVTSSENKPTRPQSQMSMASSSSQDTQSQGGFLNQASKLLSSALGTGKKKPEVKKVMTKAAAAAKKQQEEADKKAVRLKEMENRRQQAIQKKAEEEKARQVEEERKMKEDIERRKREREEQAEKQRSVKPTPVKKDEESQTQKKPLVEKKPELKKTTSLSNMNKSQLKPALKSSILTKNSTYAGSSQAGPSSKPAEVSKLPKFAPSSSSNKGKAKAAQAMTEDELGQPSQLLHDQMAARAKAQIKAAKTEHLVPSESIELPDINSEYSDSDDEDRKRTYDPPDWAQSPDLREQLKAQASINPDDIFGAVRPLRMEEIFKTRTSRFRARTSSANWTGTDRLTVAEEKDYASRMGFK
ncbi:hypothetical protein DFP72DRAFT_952997 [Ephemerocybe angulata]|uniref:Inner centromere protein ARK-binding domain-containing protein n=1 Tax=Ephemerocybe angulata TaxID=980116 RepID=A0A8H6II60_9AGAR|nr:hypothetical protein DFP72DRAFT_952997 [Tulosesus angulatus]